MTNSEAGSSFWRTSVPLAGVCAVIAGLEIFQAFRLGTDSHGVYVALGGALLAAIGMLCAATSALSMPGRARIVKLAEREREEQFHLLVEGVADYAIYMMDPNGYVTTWNLGAKRIKGYSEDEIIGQHYVRFFTEEDATAGVHKQILETAARQGRCEVEAWRVRKDGSRFYVNAVVTALRDATGKLAGFAKVTRDVTERLQQQEALEQARAALAQAQKMEALGQLTGGMAHDFNNILHVINNCLTIVEKRLQETDPASVKYLQMAHRNAVRAAAITQRLLAFARQQPLDPKPAAANQLITSMADIVRHAAGEAIAVETVFGGGLWPILADVNQLESALLNLVLNSRDAMGGSGKLTIETGNVLLDESYSDRHADVKPGQYVMIAVSDTGCGMPAETAARAFDPFFTTKGPGEGTGLGLSQVFGFVKQSGGHIKIYSEPGQGTTVKIYLPRLLTETGALVAEPVPPPLPGQGRTILLVEDHEDARAFTAEMLRSMGYQVADAADAPSALRSLDRLGTVDLLFTDVGLPGQMNGRLLADEARKRQPGLCVLYTTGYARNAIIHHGRLDPGVHLLPKPFTQAEMARKIREALDEKEV